MCLLLSNFSVRERIPPSRGGQRAPKPCYPPEFRRGHLCEHVPVELPDLGLNAICKGNWLLDRGSVESLDWRSPWTTQDNHPGWRYHDYWSYPSDDVIQLRPTGGGTHHHGFRKRLECEVVFTRASAGGLIPPLSRLDVDCAFIPRRMLPRRS